jgi:hypothetical protein
VRAAALRSSSMTSDSAVEILSFDALPEPALRVTMLALPVDARARAACVCRAWRAFLADPSLWQVLDLTFAGGFEAWRTTINLMRGAVKRAAGELRILRFQRVGNLDMEKLFLDVILSDGAELQEVDTDVWLSVENFVALFAAAPRLQVLNAGIMGGCRELLPFLRNDPPYGLLRLSELILIFKHDTAPDVMLELAAASATHDSLTGLSLSNVRYKPGLNALINSAVVRRDSRLNVFSCDTNAETIPALARLLQRGSLTEFKVSLCTGFPLAQEASVPTLCAALRTCRTLKHLTLGLNPSNGASCRTVTELLDAAATLPALSELDMGHSVFQDTAAAGHALGALLAANLPNLHTLNVTSCDLGDEGMAALLDGLAGNTHLQVLYCDNNNMSEAFERDRLQPALVALQLAAL